MFFSLIELTMECITYFLIWIFTWSFSFSSIISTSSFCSWLHWRQNMSHVSYSPNYFISSFNFLSFHFVQWGFCVVFYFFIGFNFGWSFQHFSFVFPFVARIAMLIFQWILNINRIFDLSSLFKWYIRPHILTLSSGNSIFTYLSIYFA